MIEKFVPDIYAQSIYRIDYEKLVKKGIKCVIFDLDNTIVPVDRSTPSRDAVNLMFKIKSLGLKPILMSNSMKKRVEPFRNILEIDSCASSKKPLKKNYKKILSIYKFKNEEVACIGDQLITDIWGANGMGMTSILVNPISKKDKTITLFNRFLEGIIMKRLESKELFKKGAYYD